MRGKTCGSCKLRLQYKCRKLCSCCHKWETCGGCNIKTWELCNRFPARENLWWPQYKRGKLYNCCHKREKSENLLRLPYKGLKLCNYCHMRQNLWWLQYRRENLCYGTAAMRGKTCGGDKLRLQN